MRRGSHGEQDRGASALVAVLVVATLALVPSCRQILGIEERETRAGERTCEVFVFADAECGSCMQGCCEAATACHADPPCRAVLECAAACGAGEAACRDACEDKGTFDEARARLRACQAERCSQACKLVCGGAGLPRGAATGAEGCGCADLCCDEATRCAASVECGQLEVCTRATCPSGEPGVDCRERCANDFPEGASRKAAVSECVLRACGGLGDWTCVGSVRWEKPDHLEEREIELVTIDHEFTVAACESVECINPKDEVEEPVSTAYLNIKLLDVEKGYTGPLDITLTDVEQPRAYLMYLHPPVVRDARFEFVALDYPTAAIDTSTRLMADRGHLQVYLEDCRGKFAPGVRVSASTADAATRRFYSAPEVLGEIVSWSGVTSSGSTALFLNLPAGPVTVTAVVDGLCIQSAELELFIHPGKLTVTEMMPTPPP